MIKQLALDAIKDALLLTSDAYVAFLRDALKPHDVPVYVGGPFAPQ